MNCPQCGSRLVEYAARPERGEAGFLHCPNNALPTMLPEWCPQGALPLPVHIVLEREGHARLPGLP